MPVALLDPHRPEQPFPPLYEAMRKPNGLLAIGGCLSPQRIINAYRHGIFPWYNPGEPLLWWSPDPRLILRPERLHVSRSLSKSIRGARFRTTFDTAFSEIIAACADSENRKDSNGTWLTPEMQYAYRLLHRQGIAHSVETWADGMLEGGLYGLAIGRVFFGESMFHRRTDASKIAFVALVERLRACGYALIDCQVSSGHLLSLGAEEISRSEFADCLQRFCSEKPDRSAWSMP